MYTRCLGYTQFMAFVDLLRSAQCLFGTSYDNITEHQDKNKIVTDTFSDNCHLYSLTWLLNDFVYAIVYAIYVSAQ